MPGYQHLRPVSIRELEEKSVSVRQKVLRMFGHAGEGHFGGCYSCVEILNSLYSCAMRVNPEKPKWEDRDRFFLSKGHAGPALYAVLCEEGFFPEEWISRYEELGSELSTHPNMHRVPGLDISSGSLGHGLSIAAGCAIAAKMDAKTYRVFALIGDGESAEGAIWEAAMTANKFKLDNLIAFTDRNHLCVDGLTEGVMPLGDLGKKWESFGWQVFGINGHCYEEILSALDTCISEKNGRPKMIIADTVKGKGVSFMENRREWHGSHISPEQRAQAARELEKGVLLG